ncbi:T9SS type A sorting domain-containing protein [Aestuariivivens sediminicola]|uniref:T9SS type A sorting domain-containing protein n=1 Tax=Aestuariivivens sediminicola TaxID=2913560 RepID=UPI001F5777CD|nr:T9SS type A sorting domain-containing protein [Aestuariivivens sediminicola]
MKNLIITLFTMCLCAFYSFSQIQIGNDIYGEAAEDNLGACVSLSSDGSFVAVGAPFKNNYTGMVRVYENLNGIWSQIGNAIYGESESVYFGHAISLSSDGSVMAVGAFLGSNFGRVRIFKYTGGDWTQIGNGIDGQSGDTFFGYSVSLSADGRMVAIGAPSNLLIGLVDSHIRIYENIQGVWTQIGNDIMGDSNFDMKGWSLSLSDDGSKLAIGAPGSNVTGDFSGMVTVYEKTEDDWTSIGNTINAENEGDFFGNSVSLSGDGNTVAIGAPGFDSSYDWGYVQIYKNSSGIWTQLGNRIEAHTVDDRLGCSVSLSSDGSLVAIGAAGDDSHGTDAGLVRIYRNISGIWTQIGNVIAGESPNSNLGACVNISSDGRTVAVGAPSNDTYLENSGQVKIFDLSALLSTQEYIKPEVKVYPNPTSQELNIELNQRAELQCVNLHNALGQIVMSGKELRVDVSHLKSGLYFIQVITKNGKITKRVIIN